MSVMIANPCTNGKRAKPKVKPKPSPSPRHGAAQAQFISSSRLELEAGVSDYFAKKDWTRLKWSTPASLVNAKRISPQVFYVKDLAVWIPHMLIPGHVPSCAKCLSKEGVNPCQFRFVEFPKILYGLTSHRYLDSVHYWCENCKGDFQACHPETLKRDGKELVGVLNFRMSKGFVVDDELYRFITTHGADTTTSDHQRINAMHANHYVCEASFCYRAMLAKRIKPHNSSYVTGTNQTTLDHLLVQQPELTRDQKRQQSLRFDLGRLELQLKSKQSVLEGDIHFSDVFRRKKNRNSIGELFPGIGKRKILTLLEHDIYTARDLLNYEGDSPAVKENWKNIVQNYFDNLSLDLSSLEQRIESLKTELRLDMIITDGERPSRIEAEAAADGDPLPPPFSRLTDPTRYNCQTVSKASIDQILMNDFQRRNPMQRAKMRAMPAKIMKVDFHYKVAKKIKVFTGRGESFTPFKCAVTIQNEDAMTIYFLFLPTSESIEAMLPDLRRLKRRQAILNTETSVFYVDNCCSVRGKIKTEWPDALVLLASFHWMVRWDDIMYGKTSENTTTFQTLMRRALFLVEDAELERAKQVLISQKKKPTTQAIFKEAKSTMPSPEFLERRVMAVIHTLMGKDTEGDLRRTTENVDAQTKEGRFFKRGANALNTIVNKLEHVKKGCLSDPHMSVAGLHRFNATTLKTYSARGSSSIEVDNRWVLNSLNTPSVGLTRAERILWDHYEASKDRKKVQRLGAIRECCTRTEQLQMLHGLATKAGFDEADLGVQPPDYPRDLDALEEHLGFDYELPDNFLPHVAAEDKEEVCAGDLANFLEGLGFGDDSDDDDDDGEDADISILLPTIIDRETTYDTFKRKTEQAPWVPFKHPKHAATFTELDKTEHELFDRMSTDYSRDAKLDTRRGYKAFAKAWGLQVANIFRSKLDGELVQIINRKSYVQLQEHSDNQKKHRELLNLSQADPQFERLNEEFRITRRLHPAHQTATATAPNTFPPTLGRPQFGVPLPLNTDIVANAFQHGQQPCRPLVFETQQIIHRS